MASELPSVSWERVRSVALTSEGFRLTVERFPSGGRTEPGGKPWRWEVWEWDSRAGEWWRCGLGFSPTESSAKVAARRFVSRRRDTAAGAAHA